MNHTREYEKQMGLGDKIRYEEQEQMRKEIYARS